MHNKPIALFFSFILIFPIVAIGAECFSKSKDHVVPLLELYTSEGCSSCPPADKWLSQLSSTKGRLTTLAFHVDYWDYIGWKDRFAKTEYSNRQRQMAEFAGSSYIYTPQFIMNGRDFHNWNNAKINQSIANNKSKSAQLRLTLSTKIQKNGDMSLFANAQGNVDVKNAEVFVALYKNGLFTEVKGGENNGSFLKHDHVVHELFGAYSLDINHSFSKSFPLATTEWKENNNGAVIFVQDKNGMILQSLDLPFCNNHS